MHWLHEGTALFHVYIKGSMILCANERGNREKSFGQDIIRVKSNRLAAMFMGIVKTFFSSNKFKTPFCCIKVSLANANLPSKRIRKFKKI